MKRIGFITLILGSIFVTYGIIRASDIFFGSPVHVSLTDKSSSRMAVFGKAKNTKKLLVNGNETFIDVKGNFMYDFSPLPGLNVVTVETTDSFGNSTEKIYSFVYNNEQQNKTAQK